MLHTFLLVYFLFAMNIEKHHVLQSEAFCDLGVAATALEGRLWVKASSTCCGKVKLFRMSYRHLYQCLDKCYTKANCTSVYFDRASSHCVLFNIEHPSDLINMGYMNEAIPDSPSYLVKLNRENAQKLV